MHTVQTAERQEPSCRIQTMAAVSWQWHIQAALAQCSSRQPAVHADIGLQQVV